MLPGGVGVVVGVGIVVTDGQGTQSGSPTTNLELREDGSIELREDGTYELRG